MYKSFNKDEYTHHLMCSAEAPRVDIIYRIGYYLYKNSQGAVYAAVIHDEQTRETINLSQYDQINALESIEWPDSANNDPFVYYALSDEVVKLITSNCKHADKDCPSVFSSREVDNKIKEELYLLLDEIPASIYWKDQFGRYLGINKLCLSFTGLTSREQIIGKKLSDIYVKKELFDLVETVEKEDLEIINKRIDKSLEEKGVDSFGNSCWYFSIKRPINTQSMVGMIGISININDKKKIEQCLESANNAKSEFIANLSHDLRTPLAGITGTLEVLLSSLNESRSFFASHPAPDTISDYAQGSIDRVSDSVRTAKDSAEELVIFFNNILEAMRLESSHCERQEVVVFSIKELVEKNVRLLKPMATHKKLDFTFEFDSILPEYVSGVPDYMERALLNVVTNAIKFTASGFVKIEVLANHGLTGTPAAGESIDFVFKISDSGIGIPRDKLESIFGLFSRLDPSYNGHYKGTGLGLFSARKYLHLLRGKITAESTVNEGSCFTMTIPFVASDAQTAQALREALPPSMVLLVEDSKPVVLAVKSMLEGMNCTVHTVDSGEEAVKHADEHDYDVVFMDIGLPDISGIEATKNIRALDDQEKANVPVIALTGHMDAKKRRACIGAGMQDILRKPASNEALKTMLRRYL